MKSENEIKLLLEKFYEGTTSSEEELIIKEFFLTCDDISDDLKADKELFDIFENGDVESSLDEIIIRSLNVKKSVVEQDEKESG